MNFGRRDQNKGVSRRNLMRAGGLAALVGGSGIFSAQAIAAGQSAGAIGQPTFSPEYAKVPLRKDDIKVLLIQSPDIAIDYANAAKGHRENLDRMISLMRKSRNNFNAEPDLYAFHEMPLHGFGEWDRAQALRVAIEAPGPETEELGKLAREYNAYISFGAYVRDKDWPDHVIMMGILIGPDGKLAAKHWKARGSLTGLGLFTSTVHENLDRYVEMYGWDEVIPVARTDIGNICLTGVQNDPMLFTAMGLKGVEILSRFATGGMPTPDAIMMSKAANAYTVYANSSYHPDHRFYVNGVGVGKSVIIDPSGNILAEAPEDDHGLPATLKVGDLRKRRKAPDFQWDLYSSLFESYQGRFEPNWFTRYLPKSWADTRAFFKDKARW